MPEILSMIQVDKMTPAPGVLIVALLSLGYLCSSDIFALINYVGFATWVLTFFFKSNFNLSDIKQSDKLSMPIPGFDPLLRQLQYLQA